MVTGICKILGEAEETRKSGRWGRGREGLWEIHVSVLCSWAQLREPCNDKRSCKGQTLLKVQLHCAGYIFLGCLPLALLF